MRKPTRTLATATRHPTTMRGISRHDSRLGVSCSARMRARSLVSKYGVGSGACHSSSKFRTETNSCDSLVQDVQPSTCLWSASAPNRIASSIFSRACLCARLVSRRSIKNERRNSTCDFLLRKPMFERLPLNPRPKAPARIPAQQYGWEKRPNVTNLSGCNLRFGFRDLGCSDDDSPQLSRQASRDARSLHCTLRLGFVICNIKLPSPGWIVGVFLGLLLSLPDAIITKAMAPILVSGAIGGLIIGIIAARFGS